MPSAAAARRTPARLERDSRISSVCIWRPDPAQLVRQARQALAPADAGRVVAEGGPEALIGQQPLDEDGGVLGVI